jgi:hypothetical protein
VPKNHRTEKYLLHQGHHIEVVTYATAPVNVSIECTSCNEVLTDEEIG